MIKYAKSPEIHLEICVRHAHNSKHCSHKQAVAATVQPYSELLNTSSRKEQNHWNSAAVRLYSLVSSPATEFKLFSLRKTIHQAKIQEPSQ